MAKTRKAAKKATLHVSVDRRATGERRAAGERRMSGEGAHTERRTSQRRAVARRRQIDPTTCERDYTPDEIEFMQAMDAYKRSSGRMFPTCSEVLEVLRHLGYVKSLPPSPIYGAESEAIEREAAVQPEDELHR